MSDAVGGAKRCSRVAKVRICALCKRHVESGHKFSWVPVGKLGYYRLQHRDCDFPDCYDHDARGKAQLVRDTKFRAYMGRNLTKAEQALLEALPGNT